MRNLSHNNSVEHGAFSPFNQHALTKNCQRAHVPLYMHLQPALLEMELP